MASAIKVCRVCGKEYEACRSANRNAGVFRWQEVACSPECGVIYLERVNESRNIVTAQKKSKHKKEVPQPVVEPVVETVFETVAEEPVVETVEPASEAPVENE